MVILRNQQSDPTTNHCVNHSAGCCCANGPDDFGCMHSTAEACCGNDSTGTIHSKHPVESICANHSTGITHKNQPDGPSHPSQQELMAFSMRSGNEDQGRGFAKMRYPLDNYLQNLGTRIEMTLPPSSPALSPETQEVLENAERLVKNAQKQIMEVGLIPPLSPVQENSIGPADESLLHLREIIGSKFQESSDDTGKVSQQGMTLKDRISLNPKSRCDQIHIKDSKDTINTKLGTVTQRSATSTRRTLKKSSLHNDRLFVEKAPNWFNKVERPSHLNVFPVKMHNVTAELTAPPSTRLTRRLTLNTGVFEVNSRGERTNTKFQVQKGPTLDIQRALTIQNVENVHISPDPSYVPIYNNVATFSVQHGSSRDSTPLLSSVDHIRGSSSGQLEEKRTIERDEESQMQPTSCGGKSGNMNPDNEVTVAKEIKHQTSMSRTGYIRQSKTGKLGDERIMEDEKESQIQSHTSSKGNIAQNMQCQSLTSSNPFLSKTRYIKGSSTGDVGDNSILEKVIESDSTAKNSNDYEEGLLHADKLQGEHLKRGSVQNTVACPPKVKRVTMLNERQMKLVARNEVKEFMEERCQWLNIENSDISLRKTSSFPDDSQFHEEAEKHDGRALENVSNGIGIQSEYCDRGIRHVKFEQKGNSQETVSNEEFMKLQELDLSSCEVGTGEMLEEKLPPADALFAPQDSAEVERFRRALEDLSSLSQSPNVQKADKERLKQLVEQLFPPAIGDKLLESEDRMRVLKDQIHRILGLRVNTEPGSFEDAINHFVDGLYPDNRRFDLLSGLFSLISSLKGKVANEPQDLPSPTHTDSDNETKDGKLQETTTDDNIVRVIKDNPKLSEDRSYKTREVDSKNVKVGRSEAVQKVRNTDKLKSRREDGINEERGKNLNKKRQVVSHRTSHNLERISGKNTVQPFDRIGSNSEIQLKHGKRDVTIPNYDTIIEEQNLPTSVDSMKDQAYSTLVSMSQGNRDQSSDSATVFLDKRSEGVTSDEFYNLDLSPPYLSDLDTALKMYSRSIDRIVQGADNLSDLLSQHATLRVSDKEIGSPPCARKPSCGRKNMTITTMSEKEMANTRIVVPLSTTKLQLQRRNQQSTEYVFLCESDNMMQDRSKKLEKKEQEENLSLRGLNIRNHTAEIEKPNEEGDMQYATSHCQRRERNTQESVGNKRREERHYEKITKIVNQTNEFLLSEVAESRVRSSPRSSKQECGRAVTMSSPSNEKGEASASIVFPRSTMKLQLKKRIQQSAEHKFNYMQAARCKKSGNRDDENNSALQNARHENCFAEQEKRNEENDMDDVISRCQKRDGNSEENAGNGKSNQSTTIAKNTNNILAKLNDGTQTAPTQIAISNSLLKNIEQMNDLNNDTKLVDCSGDPDEAEPKNIRIGAEDKCKNRPHATVSFQDEDLNSESGSRNPFNTYLNLETGYSRNIETNVSLSVDLYNNQSKGFVPYKNKVLDTLSTKVEEAVCLEDSENQVFEHILENLKHSSTAMRRFVDLLFEGRELKAADEIVKDLQKIAVNSASMDDFLAILCDQNKETQVSGVDFSSLASRPSLCDWQKIHDAAQFVKDLVEKKNGILTKVETGTNRVDSVLRSNKSIINKIGNEEDHINLKVDNVACSVHGETAGEVYFESGFENRDVFQKGDKSIHMLVDDNMDEAIECKMLDEKWDLPHGELETTHLVNEETKESLGQKKCSDNDSVNVHRKVEYRETIKENKFVLKAVANEDERNGEKLTNRRFQKNGPSFLEKKKNDDKTIKDSGKSDRTEPLNTVNAFIETERHPAECTKKRTSGEDEKYNNITKAGNSSIDKKPETVVKADGKEPVSVLNKNTPVPNAGELQIVEGFSTHQEPLFTETGGKRSEDKISSASNTENQERLSKERRMGELYPGTASDLSNASKNLDETSLRSGPEIVQNESRSASVVPDPSIFYATENKHSHHSTSSPPKGKVEIIQIVEEFSTRQEQLLTELEENGNKKTTASMPGEQELVSKETRMGELHSSTSKALKNSSETSRCNGPEIVQSNTKSGLVVPDSSIVYAAEKNDSRQRTISSAKTQIGVFQTVEEFSTRQESLLTELVEESDGNKKSKISRTEKRQFEDINMGELHSNIACDLLNAAKNLVESSQCNGSQVVQNDIRSTLIVPDLSVIYAAEIEESRHELLSLVNERIGAAKNNLQSRKANDLFHNSDDRIKSPISTANDEPRTGKTVSDDRNLIPTQANGSKKSTREIGDTNRNVQKYYGGTHSDYINKSTKLCLCTFCKPAVDESGYKEYFGNANEKLGSCEGMQENGEPPENNPNGTLTKSVQDSLKSHEVPEIGKPDKQPDQRSICKKSEYPKNELHETLTISAQDSTKLPDNHCSAEAQQIRKPEKQPEMMDQHLVSTVFPFSKVLVVDSVVVMRPLDEEEHTYFIAKPSLKERQLIEKKLHGTSKLSNTGRSDFLESLELCTETKTADRFLTYRGCVGTDCTNHYESPRRRWMNQDDTPSETCSEGEIRLLSSDSYSLGERRIPGQGGSIVGKSFRDPDGMTVFITRSVLSSETDTSNSLVQSSGEVHGTEYDFTTNSVAIGSEGELDIERGRCELRKFT